MFGPLEEQSLAPGFYIPPNSDYDGYHAYVDEALPPESPYLYGLHPNAEIEFLTMTSENVFRTVLELQPRDSGASGGSAASRDDKVGHNARISFYNRKIRIDTKVTRRHTNIMTFAD